MSAGIRVSAYILRKVLNDISPLFPTGTHTIPVLFKAVGSELTIACTTGCNYLNTIAVHNEDNLHWETTVSYKNLLDFIKDGMITVEQTQFGLDIVGDDFKVQLPVAYSTVTIPKLEDVSYNLVDSKGYLSGFRNLLNMGLAQVLSAEKPIHVYSGVSVLRYPNIQAQVRTPGFDCTMVIAPEHAKLLVRFEPEEYAFSKTDSALLLRRQNATLALPISMQREENHFTEFLQGMSEPVTVQMGGFLVRLRSMSKLSPRGRVKLVIRESGVEASVQNDNAVISTALGDIESKVLTALHVPMPLFLAMVKVIGDSTAQFLYKEDLLCLRTQFIIIVTRALV